MLFSKQQKIRKIIELKVLLSRVWLFTTPWTLAYQAPPFMGFSRQEYWSGLPFPSPNKTKPKVSRKKWYHKDQSRNTWKRSGDNRKYQKNYKLVLWEDKQNWKTITQTHQEKKKKKEKTQTNETRNEKGEAATDEAELHGLKWDYHKQLLIISVGSGLQRLYLIKWIT